jgi:hypothetical protein
MRSTSSWFWLSVCLTAGCAADISPKGDASTGTGEKATSKSLGDGVTETTVDATKDTEWQRFDLDAASAVETDDDDSKWDLEFNRFQIRSNGGVTGPGGVRLAQLSDQSFDELKRAPNEGFEEDREDGPEDENTDSDNVFNGGDDDWYAYNVMNHTLSPHDVTYVVESTAQSYFKLRIVSYYDKNGTSGWLRFDWADIEPPE